MPKVWIKIIYFKEIEYTKVWNFAIFLGCALNLAKFGVNVHVFTDPIAPVGDDGIIARDYTKYRQVL